MNRIHGYGRAAYEVVPLTLERQKIAFDAWCQSSDCREHFADHVAGQWYEDDSGSSPKPHSWLLPQLSQLIRDATKGDVLVVAYVDFISQDQRELVQLLAALGVKGVSLWEMGSGFHSADIKGQATIERMRLQNELQGFRHKRAIELSRAAIHEAGGTTLSNPPLGWKRQKTYSRSLKRNIYVLKPNHEERQLAEYVSELQDNGSSIEGIRDRLFEEGVFPKRKRHRAKNKSSKHFGRRQLRNLINANEQGYPQKGSNFWPSPVHSTKPLSPIDTLEMLLLTSN